MKKQKLTNRQVQALTTKNKIYNIAVELLEESRYENIKIENICKKAEVSVGSFYNYFEFEVIENLKSINSLDKIVEFFTYYANYNKIVGIDAMK